MKVTLVYLPGALFEDRVALREIVTNYHKLAGRTLLVHTGTNGSHEKTAFQTKRLSGALSEEMVPNTAFSGYQRSFLRQRGEAYLVRHDLLQEIYRLVDCVVLNNLSLGPDGIHAADPAVLLPYLRDQIDCIDCRVFTHNPRSALAAEPRAVACDADLARLIPAFEEERNTLELASRLRPAWVVSSRNFHHEGSTTGA